MFEGRSAGAAVTEWYFVRHGQTDWNASHRIQGQEDVPLNDHGRAQARSNGERFATLWRHQHEPHVVASPLLRTRETADIFREAAGLSRPCETDARLREIHFGQWQRRTLVEVWHETPEPVEARKRDKWNFQVPGGESYAMLAARALPVLDDLPPRAVVVSHGGTMRTIIRRLTNLPEAEAAELAIPQDAMWLWNGHAGEWV